MNVFGATGARPAWDQEELAHALDYSSPWVQGMKSLFVWSEGEYPHNLINGRVATQNNPGYQHNSMNAYGAFGGYQGDWSIGPASEIYAASSTFMMLRRRRSSGAQSSSAFGDGGGLNVHMPWSDSNVYWDYPTSGSRVSYASTPTSNPELWILTGGARGRDLVINGIKRTLSGNPTTTGSPSGTFKIGAGTSPGEDMDIGLFASWGWQMPVDMAIELSHDLFGCLFGDNGLPAVAAAFAGIATSIGLATETDAAFGITWSKRRAVGLAAETDSALAAVARRTRAVGQTAETDSAFAVARAKLRAVGLAAESDAALALTALRARVVALASETDIAQPVTIGSGVAIGQVVETDTALGVGRFKLRAAGLAGETDTAMTAAARRTKAAGLTAETDTAPAIGHAKAGTAGLAMETDEALAVTVSGGGGAPATGSDWLVVARRRGRR